MTLYKVLGPDRRAYHGGTGQWPPTGEWLRVDGPLVACKHGLHLCRERDLVQWLGPEIWEAEYEGEMVECDDKIVVHAARLVRRFDRWTDRTARLFAVDCAEHVMPFFEARYPSDARLRDAIAAARAFSRGEISAAALDAASDAAWAAARATARAAASDAALDAARDAARRDAARAAARAAAWAAARRDAAWAAAWDAALAAARDAARDVERTWQTARLIAYLRGEVS